MQQCVSASLRVRSVSEHPLTAAIVAAAIDRGLKLSTPEQFDYESGTRADVGIAMGTGSTCPVGQAQAGGES